jgi:uncharacterized protein YggE
MSNTELTVRGNATVSNKPDAIRIDLGLESVHKQYDVAIRKLNEVVRECTAILTDCGAINTPVTERFSVDESWSSWRGDKNNKFIGYEASQKLSALIELDMINLSQVLRGISSMRSTIRPHTSLSFVVQDTSLMLQEARRRAIAAALASAQDIATQLGLEILGIESIQYNQPANPHANSIMVDLGSEDSDLTLCASMALPDITPREVMRQDDVTIKWRCAAVG